MNPSFLGDQKRKEFAVGPRMSAWQCCKRIMPSLGLNMRLIIRSEGSLNPHIVLGLHRFALWRRSPATLGRGKPSL
jgi:hypothetical protein